MGKRQRGKEDNNQHSPDSRVARNAKGPRKDQRRWYRSPMVWIVVILIVTVLAGGAVGAYRLAANSSDESADDAALTVATTTQAPPMTETERIVSQMTVEEKVGQMMMVGFEGTDPEGAAAMVNGLHVGGLVLFTRNIDTNEQVTQMNASLQQLAFDSGHPVGLLIAVDQEGGKTRRFTDIGPYYSEPMIGEMPDDAAEQTARLQASSAARDLKRIGINTNLAPVLDVSGGWGTVMDVRSFSDDTDLVTRLGAEAVKGYVGASTICVPKHFPGLGSAEGDPRPRCRDWT
ncbi:MAG: glycoside hydrolase family 3 N-terminal domain-containing protein [Thermoleophilia bacterium]